MNGTAANKLIVNALPCRPRDATSLEEIPPLEGELEGFRILLSGKILYQGGATNTGEEIFEAKGKPRLNVQEVLKKYHLYVKVA